MEATVSNPFEIRYEGETIDVRLDIGTIPDSEWRIENGSCEKGRVRGFRIIGTATEPGSKSGREYRFNVAYDLLSGGRVGTPTVRVFDYMDDLFKPAWTLLKEFKGMEAEGLCELLKNVRLPESALQRPAADGLEELEMPAKE